MKTKAAPLTFSLIFIFFLVTQATSQVTITPDRPDGIYHSGETVTWTIKREGDKALKSLRYTLKAGGLREVEKGLINPKDTLTRITYRFDDPGTVILLVQWGNQRDFFSRAVGGALADMDQFELSAPRPDDFDAFWAEKVKELEGVDMNPRLEQVPSDVEGVDYYEIKMDNIRGSLIQGQLARPSKGRKFPALLIVQWAGVYPLQKNWVLDRAREGWLVLNIMAHDLPILNDPDFYREQSRGALRNYPAIGNNDRDSSYFLRMYLSCYRAAEYLVQRPDWNGKNLVVTGTSQGGQQAVMTAGFHPEITGCVALVPAGFDMLGPEVGRKGGWPQWYFNTRDKDPEKVREASRYYDVANFVPNINCPVFVGVGLLDETCPPEGIIAGLNQLSDSKEVMLMPNSGHQNRNGGQDGFNARRDEVWLPALQKGLKKGLPD